MSKIKSPWDDNDETESPWGAPEPSRQKVKQFKPKIPSEFQLKWGWVAAAVVALWGASGFYQVQPNEEALVLRFGAYVDTTTPGLHYHLPYPIETVRKVNITQERSINLGAVENRDVRNDAFTESHMLTGDENIVDINLTIVWRVDNAKDYAFNMQNPDQTVRVAAQSVLR